MKPADVLFPSTKNEEHVCVTQNLKKGRKKEKVHHISMLEIACGQSTSQLITPHYHEPYPHPTAPNQRANSRRHRVSATMQPQTQPSHTVDHCPVLVVDKERPTGTPTGT